jgi:glycerol 3-phosphatase-2
VSGLARDQGASHPDDRSPLVSRYDAVLLDLDGVVYRGDEAVAGAVEALEGLTSLGVPRLFLTNNSSRTPSQVVEKLAGLGIVARLSEVLTSSLATAAMLRREGAAGASAFVIGERGIREALTQVGVTVLEGAPRASDLVVVGWDRGVDYDKLRTAALLVQRGARFVATNPDGSFPAPDGLWPGAGAIAAAVSTTTGVHPTVVGKPARPLFEAAAEATGAERPLVVGDRLDTDIDGAAGMAWDSMLVWSGAATPPDLLRAPNLPTYLAEDVRGLLRAAPRVAFRRASPGDGPAVASLLRSAGLSDNGVEERFAETVVGEAGGETVATACLQAEGDAGILRSVAVAQEARGFGIGMLVTAAALSAPRGDGLRPIALFTETAAGFFERLGFRRVPRTGLPEAVQRGPHASEECAASAQAMVVDLD